MFSQIEIIKTNWLHIDYKSKFYICQKKPNTLRLKEL